MVSGTPWGKQCAHDGKDLGLHGTHTLVGGDSESKTLTYKQIRCF